MKTSHLWKARLVVGAIMLALALLGVMLTDTRITEGIDYWTWVVPVFAILTLWLSWYAKRENKVLSSITLVHELLHWTGLILSIFLVSYLVHLGTISRFVAGIFNLTLLGLSVFIAGAYLDRMFLLIGLILSLFALLTALLVQYMYAIAIPIAIAGLLILGIYFWFLKTKAKTE